MQQPWLLSLLHVVPNTVLRFNGAVHFLLLERATMTDRACTITNSSSYTFHQPADSSWFAAAVRVGPGTIQVRTAGCLEQETSSYRRVPRARVQEFTSFSM